MGLSDWIKNLFLAEARAQGVELDYWLRNNQWVFLVFAFILTFFIILVGRRVYLLYFKKARGKKR